MFATAAAAKVPSVEITRHRRAEKSNDEGKNEVVAESRDQGKYTDAQQHAEKLLALVRGRE